jgi:DDE superfamily endonuclease
MSGANTNSDQVVSRRLSVWLQPFSDCFTLPTWRHVLVLVAGAILSPGRRTVAAALRVVGLDQEASFTNYHRVLNRNSWSSRRVAGRLLRLLVSAFVPDGPVIIGLDDTLERRWGSKIKARGIYRDPVRSSHGHFVKASGLRWLSVMLLPDIPWAGRVWGLPFLIALAPPSDMPSSISGDIRNSPTGPDRPCCRWRNGCLAGRLSRSPTAATR